MHIHLHLVELRFAPMPPACDRLPPSALLLAPAPPLLLAPAPPPPPLLLAPAPPPLALALRAMTIAADVGDSALYS